MQSFTETYGDCESVADCCKKKDAACFMECDTKDKKCKILDYFVNEKGNIRYYNYSKIDLWYCK